jgi:DNA-binding CsgD family transcriptional regulator
MTKNILNFYASVETIITQLVRLIVSIASFSIGELAPLVAPLAPSFSIYLAMSQRLHMPQVVALVAAGTIEIVGMYSAKISVRCYRWNSTKGKSEAAVPQALSVAMTAVFYLVVLALALTIELIPGLTALIFPAFTLISVSVYVNMAIDQNLRQLEQNKAAEIELRQKKNGLTADIRAAKNEAATLANDIQKLANERAKLAADIDRQRRILANGNGQNGVISPLNGASLDKANEAKQDKISQRRRQVLDLKLTGLTNREIAGRLSVSIGTVKNDVRNLNGLQGVK